MDIKQTLSKEFSNILLNLDEITSINNEFSKCSVDKFIKKIDEYSAECKEVRAKYDDEVKKASSLFYERKNKEGKDEQLKAENERKRAQLEAEKRKAEIVKANNKILSRKIGFKKFLNFIEIICQYLAYLSPFILCGGLMALFYFRMERISTVLFFVFWGLMLAVGLFISIMLFIQRNTKWKYLLNRPRISAIITFSIVLVVFALVYFNFNFIVNFILTYLK